MKYKSPDNGSLTYKKDKDGSVELTVDCKREPFVNIGDLPDVKLD